MELKTVVVIVEGGVVSEVILPPGVVVLVRDYDNPQDLDEADCKKDLHGDLYCETTWN